MTDQQSDRDLWLREDPDSDAGAVTGFAFSARDYRSIPTHAHEKAQLIHVIRGVVVVRTDSALLTLPPNRAVWLPPGTMHSARYPQAGEMRSLFFDVNQLKDPPPDRVEVYALDTLNATLLREAAEFDWSAGPGRIEWMTVELLFARLRQANDPGLSLPEGRDPRLRRVTDYLQREPGDTSALDRLAEVGICSQRTLARLFKEETGMSPAVWRRQLRLANALERLAAGDPVSAIAADLGYPSPGNFTVMFKSAFGVVPSAFFR